MNSPTDQSRWASLLSLVALVRRCFPPAQGTCVAHLRVVTDGRTMDVLFGSGAIPRGAPVPGVSLVDWQRSPWTGVLLSCAEGDTYELRKEGALHTGRVVERHLLRYEEGSLAEITSGDAKLCLEPGGGFRKLPPDPRYLAERSSPARKRPRSLIAVELDPAQRSAVSLPADRTVLLLGEAGHGKTTVALHRLRHLRTGARSRFRAAILVPTEGLRRLIQPLVGRLGVDIEVMLYDRWARKQAEHAFPDLPERESQNATAGVIRIKRDPALRALLARLAKKRPGRIDDDKDAPQIRSNAHARRADLQHLFGDRALMRELASVSGQRLTDTTVSEVLEHTHVQFSQPSEVEWAHVIDADRLVPVDRRGIDEGTPLEDAGSIDAEDYAVLFELDRLRALRRKRPPTEPRAYDCIMVDEAQELAPLELALIGRSLAPSATLIVAGDADQQVDPDVSFVSWENTMAELGVKDYDRVLLEVGYRCPPGVVAMGRAVLGRAAPPSAGRDAPPSEALPRFRRFDNELLLVDWLTGEIGTLARLDRRATTCIICRSPLTARRLAGTLRLGLPASLVLDGKFLFGPAAYVTTVDQVKGLEFDYVIVPDASATTYPDDLAARRALYVALTRARHQVVLAAVGPRSPII